MKKRSLNDILKLAGVELKESNSKQEYDRSAAKVMRSFKGYSDWTISDWRIFFDEVNAEVDEDEYVPTSDVDFYAEQIFNICSKAGDPVSMEQAKEWAQGIAEQDNWDMVESKKFITPQYDAKTDIKKMLSNAGIKLNRDLSSKIKNEFKKTKLTKLKEEDEDYVEALKEAISRLEEILDELGELGMEAASIIQGFSPTLYRQGQAYGAFNFGTSENHYDTTFESLVNQLREELDSDDEEY